MKKFIVSLLLVTLAFSTAYNIRSTSQCLSFDATHGVCSKWSQTGTIQQDTAACFIGSTIVKQMTKGFIQMKDLKVGDKILTLKDKTQKWSLVQGWLHRNQKSQGLYHKITLENGEWIGASGKHNIAFQSSQSLYEYGFPVESCQGKKLYPSSEKIVSSQTFINQGIYAPLTSESSYLVFTSESFKAVLAHDFANIRYPESYQKIAQTIFVASKIINGEHLLNNEGIHVAADWMMEKFSLLME